MDKNNILASIPMLKNLESGNFFVMAEIGRAHV